MKTKSILSLTAVVVIAATTTILSIGIALDAQAQNTTSMQPQTNETLQTNSTLTGAEEGIEEGPGEDEDEPGDVDRNDEEDSP